MKQKRPKGEQSRDAPSMVAKKKKSEKASDRKMEVGSVRYKIQQKKDVEVNAVERFRSMINVDNRDTRHIEMPIEHMIPSYALRDTDDEHIAKMMKSMEKGFLTPESQVFIGVAPKTANKENHSERNPVYVIDGQHRLAAYKELLKNDGWIRKYGKGYEAPNGMEVLGVRCRINVHYVDKEEFERQLHAVTDRAHLGAENEEDLMENSVLRVALATLSQERKKSEYKESTILEMFRKMAIGTGLDMESLFRMKLKALSVVINDYFLMEGLEHVLKMSIAPPQLFSKTIDLCRNNETQMKNTSNGSCRTLRGYRVFSQILATYAWNPSVCLRMLDEGKETEAHPKNIYEWFKRVRSGKLDENTSLSCYEDNAQNSSCLRGDGAVGTGEDNRNETTEDCQKAVKGEMDGCEEDDQEIGENDGDDGESGEKEKGTEDGENHAKEIVESDGGRNEDQIKGEIQGSDDNEEDVVADETMEVSENAEEGVERIVHTSKNTTQPKKEPKGFNWEDEDEDQQVSADTSNDENVVKGENDDISDVLSLNENLMSQANIVRTQVMWTTTVRLLFKNIKKVDIAILINPDMYKTGDLTRIEKSGYNCTTAFLRSGSPDHMYLVLIFMRKHKVWDQLFEMYKGRTFNRLSYLLDEINKDALANKLPEVENYVADMDTDDDWLAARIATLCTDFCTANDL